MSGGRALHWLESAVRRKFPDACPSAWSLDPRSPAREAWARVLDGCDLDWDMVAEAVAEAFRIPVADLGAAEPTVLRLVSSEAAHRWLVLPLREDYRDLIVATCDPTNVEAEQALAFASGRSVKFEVSDPANLVNAVQSGYAPDKIVEALIGGVEFEEEDIAVLEEDDPNSMAPEDNLDSAPVIKLTNVILRDAIERGASDVHLQPSDELGLVRFRVDGTLRNHMKVPLQVLPRVVSRIKVIGGLDISDRIRPQDGKAKIAHQGKKYDLRISTVPTRGAEKVVVRILDTEGAPALADIGFHEEELARFKTLLTQREGIVLVTGPTGSGKTTTLYAALKELADDDVNIMTVEDPVEYDLPGTTQIQVNVKQNVTFASALRAILRQDPDIILVGEIRDLETAQMAVQAAMTGHLVLATLHTNDAAAAVRRLLDLGLTGPAIADTLRGAVAQRLTRRVCLACAEQLGDGALPPAEQAFAVKQQRRPKVRAVGCDECDQLGYRGRLPINEVLLMDDAALTMIAEGRGTAEVRAAARTAGMRGLRECALDLVAEGLTTAEEVTRVLGEVLEVENPDSDAMPASEAEPHPTGPTLYVSPLAVVDGASNGRGSAAPVQPTRPATLGGENQRRALIVDDDATTRIVVKGLLQKLGMEVHEVEDGTDAIKLLKTDPVWDVMVLDLEMPLLDGRDVLRVVRGSVSTATLPVLVLTGSPDPETESEVLELGADDYIRKPIEAAQVLGRIKATLRRSAVYAGVA